ncbi:MULTISPECIES: hypothetical protein [Allobacillus]|uniref:Uncharacterized protein n=1 Tax=Allobacillus salarius TaxID=1955272 RepID=A0A556PDW9_9BACI|nr:hypothetical protein [Allobacillus salarius]TSJ62592.1 hypothetical protein FPQ13_09780 [Allobacillus salarius]
MTAKTMMICPKNIQTYYHDEIKDEKNAKRKVHFMKNERKGRTISLVVEEISNGEYVLIEGFSYYSALLKAQPAERVPCLVYPKTDNRTRLLHILTYCVFVDKNTSWVLKNEVIMKLIEEHHLSEKTIAKASNIALNTVNYYILDRKIPLYIRRVASSKKAKSVLDKTSKSSVIPKEMKKILYEKAIIDKSSPNRLTTTKFNYMKEFCSANNIPSWLLRDSSRLESLIDWLLITNFNINSHMKNLLNSFILPKRTTYRIKLSQDKSQKSIKS